MKGGVGMLRIRSPNKVKDIVSLNNRRSDTLTDEVYKRI